MLTMHCLALFTIIVTLRTTMAADVIFGYENPALNLVKNWDHSDPPDGVDTTLSGGKISMSTIRFTGTHAYFIKDRTVSSGGITHVIQGDSSSPALQRNRNYYVSCFFRIRTGLNTGNYTTFKLKYKIMNSDGTKHADVIADIPYMRKDNLWYQIGGTFKTPNKAMNNVQLSLDVEPIDVDYYLDTYSLIELPHYTTDNWRAKISAKIKSTRRSKTKINFNFSNGLEAGTTTIELSHQKHEFGFGLALKAKHFTGSGDWETKYRDFVLKNFNFGGFENNFKWRTMEPEKGVRNFKTLDDAIDLLAKNDMPVRAQSVVWNRKENLPEWVTKYSGTALRSEVYTRVDYLLNHFKGKVATYDLSNEQLHGHYLEETTGDDLLLDRLFSKAHNIDKNARLSVNDYEVIRNGMKTSALMNMMKRYKGMGYPAAIGIQGHLRSYQLPIAPEVLEKRLQIVCSAGIPASITEFSVHSASETLKREELEKALLIIFSQPCVDSMVISGYSDLPSLKFTDDSVLFKGENFQPTAAGAKLLKYLNEIWKTSITYTATKSVFWKKFWGYHGTYKLVIKNGNTVLKETTFTIKSGQSNTIDVTV